MSIAAASVYSATTSLTETLHRQHLPVLAKDTVLHSDSPRHPQHLYTPYLLNGIVCGKLYNFSLPRTANHRRYSYSIAILTMNINQQYAEINADIVRNRVLYAHQHHYLYIEINNLSMLINHNNADSQTQIQWTKPLVIKQVLLDLQGRIDFVLWMDLDAVVLNCEITIESIINIPDWLYWTNNKERRLDTRDYVNLILAGDFRSVANNGIFLMHNTQWTLQFVAQWIELAQCPRIDWLRIKPKWSDNTAFIALLHGAMCSHSNTSSVQDIMHNGGRFERIQHYDVNRSFETWRNFLSTEMRRNIAVLPQKAINAYQRQSMFNFPVFVHFAGINNRSALIAQWLIKSTCMGIKL